MKPIYIGQNANDKPVIITPEMRRTTHMHVIGGSGTGKSKFLETIIRKDIDEGHGFCVIDWHGALYEDILNYCAQLAVGTKSDWRNLILINPAKPDFITGYNPFMNQGDDLSVQIQQRIDATIRPWGITNTNQMPSFERVCRVIYGFAVEQKETLPIAAMLLKYDRPELREFALKVTNHPYIKDQLQDLQYYKTVKDWREFVLSTENRLGRFLGSDSIRRFMGLAEGNLDLLEAMDQGKIVLVNLGSSGFLDREAARVFASLLLNEFFETAMLRAKLARERGEGKPTTFPLYLDEFQEYITDDIGSMLDQVRKGGLHMVLAHQHLGHLADNPKLLDSILTNARIRAVFGGLPFKHAVELANEMFLPDLNTRQIKKAYYHTTHLYREETRTVRSHGSSRSTTEGLGRSRGEGSSTGNVTASSEMSSAGKGITQPGQFVADPTTEGWFTESESRGTASSTSQSVMSSESWSETESTAYSESESESETIVPVFVPIPIQELGSETEWSLEEKRSKIAEMLKCQQQRHCFIKLDTEKTQPLRVPFVKEYFITPEDLLDYESKVYETQGAVPASQVDQFLIENEQRFLREAGQSNDDEGTEVISAPPRQAVPARKPRARPKKPEQNPYANIDPSLPFPDKGSGKK